MRNVVLFALLLAATGSASSFTRWEFTINPSGPQCKQADIYGNGQTIYFNNCTDGHTRTCRRLY